MSFYLQHGYGKSTKIQDVASDGHTQGVILSSADEDRASLRSTVSDCRALGLQTLLDPQTFAYSLTPSGSGRCHKSHGLDFNSIHWSADARQIAAIVESVDTANSEVGIEGLRIAPTCAQSSLGDVWTPLALQFARTAANEWGADRTLAALVLDEAALSNWNGIQDWLDVATTLDVAGFYISINRPKREYPPGPWDVTKLTHLLRMLYNLAILNEYRVIWAYSDIDGLIGLGAGVSDVSSGWHYSLRSFTTSKWQPSPQSGGQAPAPRLNLGSLWAPVRAEPEAAALFRTGFNDQLFPAWALSEFASRDFSTWTRARAQLQHLKLVAKRSDAIIRQADPSARISRIQTSLKNADDLYERIAKEGVILPPAYRAKVRSYQRALDDFASAESL